MQIHSPLIICGCSRTSGLPLSVSLPLTHTPRYTHHPNSRESPSKTCMKKLREDQSNCNSKRQWFHFTKSHCTVSTQVFLKASMIMIEEYCTSNLLQFLSNFKSYRNYFKVFCITLCHHKTSRGL